MLEGSLYILYLGTTFWLSDSVSVTYFMNDYSSPFYFLIQITITFAVASDKRERGRE